MTTTDKRPDTCSELWLDAINKHDDVYRNMTYSSYSFNQSELDELLRIAQIRLITGDQTLTIEPVIEEYADAMVKEINHPRIVARYCFGGRWNEHGVQTYHVHIEPPRELHVPSCIIM
jgi:hypothetical protein